MFRNWLTFLLSRPRAVEGATESAASMPVDPENQSNSDSHAFQPIRSQEEILSEERATTKRAGVISRLFDDSGAEQPVRSRPSHRANEAP